MDEKMKEALEKFVRENFNTSPNSTIVILQEDNICDCVDDYCAHNTIRSTCNVCRTLEFEF